MWQRFTENARKVVFYAQEEAQRFGEGYVSTEHLLLGLVLQPCVGVRVIEGLGVNASSVRAEVEKQLTRQDRRPSGDMTLTPRAKTVIDLAYEEARNLNNNYIGTEHLLLGLIRESEGLAGRVLAKFGIDLESARRMTIALQDADFPGNARQEVQPILWSDFSSESRGLVAEAMACALRRGHGRANPEHLLEPLLQPDVDLHELVTAMGIDPGALLATVTKSLNESSTPSDLGLNWSPRLRKALEESWTERNRTGAPLVEPHHLLLGSVLAGCLEEIGFEPDVEAGRRLLEDQD